jgi:2-keto-4-pentenoate hydratase
VNEYAIAEFARRQLADYDARTPSRSFADPVFAPTINEAYDAQHQVAELRVKRGEPIGGYKIGCVSRTVQKQLGVDYPVFGYLFVSELHSTGTPIRADRFPSLAIEGEFAVRVGNEREIASVFPVIELHNHVIWRTKATPEELIANNCLHAGVVLPRIEPPYAGAASNAISVVRNRELLGSATAGIESFTKVINHLAMRGMSLQPGQIVLTGSPLPLYPAGPGDHIVVESGGLGRVELLLQ